MLPSEPARRAQWLFFTMAIIIITIIIFIIIIIIAIIVVIFHSRMKSPGTLCFTGNKCFVLLLFIPLLLKIAKRVFNLFL